MRRQDCGGLFIFIGADAETAWLPADIARDARGYVLTGEDLKKAGRWSHGRDPYLLETSVPGVFACGDVRLSPVKRVASAVGEGSMAIALVQQFLGSPQAMVESETDSPLWTELPLQAGRPCRRKSRRAREPPSRRPSARHGAGLR